MKKIRAYHFVNSERTLLYDATTLTVEPGYIYSIGKHETPSLCNCGMHGSIRAIDALRYAPGPVVCLVGIWGDVERGEDKLCGRHREVLAVADATKILHQFACWSVRHTPIGNGKTVWDLLTDERSRKAIEVKEAWLLGKATDKELEAAEAAAWSAARSAAEAAAEAAARSAAWSAARSAAWSAAWSAARSAAEAAAWAAAEAAAWSAQDKQLTLMITEVLS